MRECRMLAENADVRHAMCAPPRTKRGQSGPRTCTSQRNGTWSWMSSGNGLHGADRFEAYGLVRRKGEIATGEFEEYDAA